MAGRQGGRGALIAAALVALPTLGTWLAGCRTGVGDAGPAAPAATAKSGCPDPECSRSGAPKVPDGGKVSKEERARAAVAAIRGPGSLTLDAEVDRPVRGRMDSQGKDTLVEVCVKEVAAAGPGRTALVRFTMRLCSENGTTNAADLRPPRTPGWKHAAVPEGWSSDEASGVPFHRYFSCAGGTAWEVDALADVLEGGVVRFTVRGEYRF